jgi:hypothetical protein
MTDLNALIERLGQARIPDCEQSNEQSVRQLSGPAWSDEAISRLLGACDGYAKAIVAVKLQIGRINYSPINKRYVRRIAQREAVLRPLREILASLINQHASCKSAYSQRSAQRGLKASALSARTRTARGKSGSEKL